MKVKDITSALEHVAELGLQEDFDNSGLLVGDSEAEIESVLLCVDITEAVLQEAVALGAGMIVSHHPIIFHPLRHITGSTYVERVVMEAVRSGIALYGCHTSLDNAPEGMSHRLGNLLGLHNVIILSPFETDSTAGTGIVGELSGEMDTVEWLAYVKRVLGAKSLRYSNIVHSKVKKVALCTGSGSSHIVDARAAGAQVYISSDFRYNNFLDAADSITIVDVGHFESEYCAIDLLYDIIRKKFPTFVLHKSKNSVNPVNYLI